MRWILNLCVVPGMVATLTLSSTVFAEQTIDLDAVGSPSATSSGTSAATTVMVPNFEGARAKTIRARFVDALESSGMNLVPQSAAGRTKLGTDPANYIFVAKANGVQAFVKGNVKLTTKRWTLTLEVRDGSNGTVIGTDTITSGWLPGLLKAIDKEAKPKVDALLAQVGKSGGVGAVEVELVAPEEDSSQADAAAADASMPTLDSTSSDAKSLPSNQVPTALVVSVGGGLILRNLSYNDAYLDTLRQALNPHEIGLWGIKLGAMWYPGAHFSDGILANIGLNAHFTRSVGGTTEVDAEKVPVQVGAPTSYSTLFQELDLGVRGRIPMGSWEMGLNLGWGKQRMGLSDDNAVVRLPYADSDEAYPGVIPDIDVEYYRFGADVGFQLFDCSWVVGAGFRTPFFSSKEGQIANERWFPNVIGTTATANVGVNIPLFAGLGLALDADFRQTGLDMNTSPTAIVIVDQQNPNQNLLRSSVAGGATDRHILLMAALTWSFGTPSDTGIGSGSAHTTADDEEEDEGDEGAAVEVEREGEEADAEQAAPASPKDTSDPSFFGESATSRKGGAASAGGSTPRAQKDTSNPDFFK